MRATIRNVLIVARREYLWRGRTRTFILATLVLMVAGLGVAAAPVIVRYVSERGGPTTVGVHLGDSHPSIDVPRALDGVLNAGSDHNADGTIRRQVSLKVVADLEAARIDVDGGRLSALLALSRGTDGELGFTLYAKGQAFEKTSTMIRQAATSIAIQDRLTRTGVPPIDQAKLFAPVSFTFRPPVDKPGTPEGPSTSEELASGYVMSFALQLFIFMAIMLYGQWVAMSVAEEKSSRVMELVLGAASPFQLLTGKVIGVGALGLTQYVLVFIPAALGMVLQDRIASLVLGVDSTSAGLPAGLSFGLLVAFGIFFVLGFALYAVLYAGAASLVSRQEDVNQIVGPLTLLSVAGYMVSSYASTGLIDISGPLLTILSFIPFLAPYLMLSRIGLGTVTPLEVLLAVAILAASIPVALWLAARVYSAGVLLYGQKPGLRTMLRAMRGA